jgi:hypothetical protein
MSVYLKIKPIYSVSTDVYPFANAIIWNCYNIYKNAETADLRCEMVNVSTQILPDNDGNPQTVEFISPVLSGFDMVVPKNILDSWGPDDIIDDFVLTYSSDFQRE